MQLDEAVLSGLHAVGFEHAESMTVWKTGKVYPSKEEPPDDIRQRKGRSNLHELNDSEIKSLVSFINDQLYDFGGIVEKDRWTIMIVWVFQIRKATRETAEETKRIAHMINDIYKLLRERSETKD